MGVAGALDVPFDISASSESCYPVIPGYGELFVIDVPGGS